MARLAPGARVGPYEVVSFLAAGGMGEVYRGHDARLGRPVAIKILPESSFDDDDAIRRFEREAKAAAAVSHPNLISIYDVGQAGDVRYLVMDLLEGETLRERLAAGPLPWPKALELGIAVVDGIAAVHAKGFVHRDLKPENIFITADGWVKLLDFGLAVPRIPLLEDADATLARVTRKGALAGTLAYMAPEQLRHEELDARSDIFATGCVLFEMLSGMPRFGGTSPADTIASILSPREVAYPAHVPEALTRIVRRCLESTRERRFSSASELASALRQLRDSGPQVTETPPSIAALPFTNLSADKENDYFSEGLSEEILNALSRVPGLKVTARTSAFAFRGRHEDIRKIGEALGVKTVLEGGVRRGGNRVRVTAQLIDAASGYQLWSSRYDRDMTDVFAVQDEIASAIVDTLQLRLAPAKRDSGTHTPDINAYHAYLKSRYHFAKLTPERLLLSQMHAEEAIALDPEYPAALAQLSECFIQSVIYGMQAGSEMIPKARAAALKAVSLDETEPSAQMSLARIAGEIDYDWNEALRRCRLSLACDRISPAVRALCAQFVLWPLRRLDELVSAIRPALAADPLSPMPRTVLAQAHVAQGLWDRAIEEMQSVIEMHETFWPAHLSLGGIHHLTGQSADAIAALEKGLAVAPWNPMFAGLLAGYTRPTELLARLERQPPVLRALGRTMYHYVTGEFERLADEYAIVMEGRYPVAAYYLSWLCLSDVFRESAAGQRLQKQFGLRSPAP